jgi:hypothetical protein
VIVNRDNPALRIRVPTLASAALLLLMTGAAQAQTFGTTTEGLNAGHFVFYPSISMEYTQDGNIFYRTGEAGQTVTRSGIYVVRPRVLVDLPIGTSRVRWVYSPVFRAYTNESFEQTKRFSHFFDLEATRSGPVLSIRATDHLVRGTVELQEVDRGGEVVFGLVPFTTHSPELELTVKAGARNGLSILPRYSSVSFQDQGEAAFFSYRRKEVEARFSRALSEPTTLYGSYTVDRTDQEREQVFFGDVSLDARTVGVGLRRKLNEQVVTSVTGGYKTITFKGGSKSNFAGPVLDGHTTWRLDDATLLELTLMRQAYQSFYVNNNYYLDQEARIRVMRQLGHSLFLDASVASLNNVYADPLDISVTPETPSDLDCNTKTVDANGDTICVGDGRIDSYEPLAPSVGRRRRDRVYRLQIGAGWQVLRTLRFFIGYNGERRSSNMEEISSSGLFDPFDYSVNRVFFRIEAGWL